MRAASWRGNANDRYSNGNVRKYLGRFSRGSGGSSDKSG